MPAVLCVCVCSFRGLFRVCDGAAALRHASPRETTKCGFALCVLREGIVAVDAVMVIAAGNGVVKEDIAAKLEVHAAYLPGQ